MVIEEIYAYIIQSWLEKVNKSIFQERTFQWSAMHMVVLSIPSNLGIVDSLINLRRIAVHRSVLSTVEETHRRQQLYRVTAMVVIIRRQGVTAVCIIP